jgi:hypothetical protein
MEDHGRLRRPLRHLFVPEEESQMFRITRIIPTTVVALAALALVSPAAQAKLESGQFGGSGVVSPSVQSTQDFNTYSTQGLHRDTGAVVITTGDRPLANPVQQQPQVLKIRSTPVPDSSGNGFDWTAAAIGAGIAGLAMLTLAAGFGFRRRGQLA